jgi:hypothetical protein
MNRLKIGILLKKYPPCLLITGMDLLNFAGTLKRPETCQT